MKLIDMSETASMAATIVLGFLRLRGFFMSTALCGDRSANG